MSAERRPLLDIYKALHSDRSCAFRIHRDPAILIKSSLHLVGGLPTARKPEDGQQRPPRTIGYNCGRQPACQAAAAGAPNTALRPCTTHTLHYRKTLEWIPWPSPRCCPQMRWNDDIKRIAGSNWMQVAQNREKTDDRSDRNCEHVFEGAACIGPLHLQGGLMIDRKSPMHTNGAVSGIVAFFGAGCREAAVLALLCFGVESETRRELKFVCILARPPRALPYKFKFSSRLVSTRPAPVRLERLVFVIWICMGMRSLHQLRSVTGSPRSRGCHARTASGPLGDSPLLAAIVATRKFWDHARSTRCRRGAHPWTTCRHHLSGAGSTQWCVCYWGLAWLCLSGNRTHDPPGWRAVAESSRSRQSVILIASTLRYHRDYLPPACRRGDAAWTPTFVTVYGLIAAFTRRHAGGK
ncbi:hypothetical protein MSG28_015690 [Choristoneura fumiferana]|uniref:Uncharacterized protein n=1 Tax=Choristoneura fumiferana TaxID=7141 RepID=A0ACC0KB34_CHOFU|nr:hypothetical protein MSG28_015690 [Choristoneura fumiferana]